MLPRKTILGFRPFPAAQIAAAAAIGREQDHRWQVADAPADLDAPGVLADPGVDETAREQDVPAHQGEGESGEAAEALTHLRRVAAADPVIPSPGRMRGRRVISSTLVPCVARSTSSSARSSYR